MSLRKMNRSTDHGRGTEKPERKKGEEKLQRLLQKTHTKIV